MYVTQHSNHGEHIVTVREDRDDQVLASFVIYGDRMRPMSPREPREALVNAALRKAGKGITYEARP